METKPYYFRAGALELTLRPLSSRFRFQALSSTTTSAPKSAGLVAWPVLAIALPYVMYSQRRRKHSRYDLPADDSQALEST